MSDLCQKIGLPHHYWPQGSCQYCGEIAPSLSTKDAEIAKLREAAAFAKVALEALHGYEADYGEALPDDYELGRIEDSRSSPSFRIRVGHIRKLAGEP